MSSLPCAIASLARLERADLRFEIADRTPEEIGALADRVEAALENACPAIGVENVLTGVEKLAARFGLELPDADVLEADILEMAGWPAEEWIAGFRGIWSSFRSGYRRFPTVGDFRAAAGQASVDGGTAALRRLAMALRQEQQIRVREIAFRRRQKEKEAETARRQQAMAIAAPVPKPILAQGVEGRLPVFSWPAAPWIGPLRHAEDALSSDETGDVRSRAASAGQPDAVGQRRGDRRLASGTAPDAGVGHGSAGGPVTPVESTGPKVYGAGERHRDKHGVRGPRTWRKLHLAVNAATLTTTSDRGASQVGPLLAQTRGPSRHRKATEKTSFERMTNCAGQAHRFFL